MQLRAEFQVLVQDMIRDASAAILELVSAFEASVQLP